jgi:ankyrin repeat protein
LLSLISFNFMEQQLLQASMAGDVREVHKSLRLHSSNDLHRRRRRKSSSTEDGMQRNEDNLLSVEDVGRVLLCLCKARINGTSTNVTMLSPKIDVVLALCRHHPHVLPSATTKRGTTALMGAALRGYAAVCQSLLEEGADVDAVNDQNQTALSFAASQGYRDVVFVLLDHGPSNATSMQDTGGRTPLLHAISGGHVGCVQRLLESRCSTDVVDAHGRTPLLVAASAGNTALCRMLTKHGADVNIASTGGAITPLMASIEHEHLDCAYMLMDELHADIHKRNSQGACALTYACKRGLAPIAVALVQRGVQVDSSNKRGTTPLMVAANNGHCDICRFLLDNGANIDVVNEDYATPMDCASTPDVNTMFVKFMRERQDDARSGRGSAMAPVGGQEHNESKYWMDVAIEGKRREVREEQRESRKLDPDAQLPCSTAATLQEVLGAIDESISIATSIKNDRATNSRRGAAERDRHRDETLLALQKQHAEITATFLGHADVDPEEVERVNIVLAERMRRFYDMCERGNAETLRDFDTLDVNEEQENASSDASSATTPLQSVELWRQQEEKDNFTYRPQSIADMEPTTAPPSLPNKKNNIKSRPAAAVHELDDESDDDDDSMMSFQCPITQVRMTDPVTCMDGHTYERSGIERWLQDHDTSPLTGVKLPSKFLIPNHSLRNAIEEWKQKKSNKK